MLYRIAFPVTHTMRLAVFKIICKRAKCDAQKISGAGGHCPPYAANAATVSAAWPWQVGEMLKWINDGKPVKPLIPIAVGEDSIAFPMHSVKAGID